MHAMHSGDLNELGGANLTDAEREALLEVMQRAKDFDDKAQKSLNSRLEGQLHKWTNALKGWQPRWLCVDQQQGVLHYYTSEDRKKAPPRGSLHLWGAVIAPSDEDSQTFVVNGANGEVYKLRAADARERQYWVSRLRNEIERCNSGYTKTQVHSASTTTTTTAPHVPPSTFSLSPLSPNTSTPDRTDLSPVSPQATTPTRKHSKTKRGLSVFASRASLKKRPRARRAGPVTDQEEGGLPGGEAMLFLLTRLQECQNTLTVQLESCSGTGIEPLDQKVLLLKATSQAAVHSVKDCLALIKLQQATPTAPPPAGNHNTSTASTAGDDTVRPVTQPSGSADTEAPLPSSATTPAVTTV